MRVRRLQWFANQVLLMMVLKVRVNIADEYNFSFKFISTDKSVKYVISNYKFTEIKELE
jgi:hypothetical protein